MSTVDVLVGSGVIVDVGVNVLVGIGVSVGIDVEVAVSVRVNVGVNVLVGVGVGSNGCIVAQPGKVIEVVNKAIKIRNLGNSLRFRIKG
ncbi:hypothetical protein ACFLYP_04130 [Chloroflexota bacterium]